MTPLPCKVERHRECCGQGQKRERTVPVHTFCSYLLVNLHLLCPGQECFWMCYGWVSSTLLIMEVKEKLSYLGEEGFLCSCRENIPTLPIAD